MELKKMTKEELINEIENLNKKLSKLEAVIEKIECLKSYSIGKIETEKDLECKFRILIENIPDVVWTSDSKGKVRFVSSDIEAICGFTPEEFYKEGVNLWRDLPHPDDKERILKAYNLLFKEGKTFDVEYRIKCKDGNWKWVHDKSIFAYEKDGILCADGITNDITERKKMEEALHYRLIIEELVTSISSRFINIPSCNIDKEINVAMRQIAKFVGIDRCYVYLLGRDQLTIEHLYEWRDEDIQAYTHKGMSLAQFSWIMEKLKKFEDIYVPRVSELPQEAKAEKDIWTEHGFQSILAIPLVLSNKLVGFFGFNSEKAEKEWKKEDINLLRLIGEIIVSMVERKQAEEVLHEKAMFSSW